MQCLPFLLSILLLHSHLAMAPGAARPSDAELAEITARGKALYEADQAAWHGTDAASELNPDVSQWPRYIAHRRDGTWVVSFGKLDENGGQFLVRYEAVHVKDDKYVPKHLDPPKADKGFLFFAARAIELAGKNFTPAASRPHNVAVLPAPDENLYVYIFPAAQREGNYPIGGDVRFLISGDGLKLLHKRQLHRTIIDRDMNQVPKDAENAAGYHSHVLSDTPEDTDVLFVLTRKPRVPEYIKTPAWTYVVDVDGKIRVVEDDR